MIIIPNVAIKGCTLRFVMSRPFARPTRTPKRIQTSETGKRSASCPRVFIEAITVTVAMTEATDKSSPPLPVRMTKVCPRDTMPSAAAGVKTFLRFCAVKKAGERNEERMKSRARKM